MISNLEEKLYKYCPQCKTDLVYASIDGRNRLHCPKCNFIYWSNPKPSVSILIHKNDEILMVQRALEPFKDYWVLPGGFLEYEETPELGIQRELKEELGLSMMLEKLIGIYQIDTDPRGIHIDIIYAGTTKDEAKLNEELKDYRFFTKDHLPENIAFKHEKAIHDYFEQK